MDVNAAALGVAALSGFGVVGCYGYTAWMLRGLLAYERHHGGSERGVVARIPALVNEGAALAVDGWWHLWDIRAASRRQEPAVSTGPLVLCVHGFLQNGTNFCALRSDLASRGRASEAVALGRPWRDPAEYVAVLGERFDRLLAGHNAPIDVVCHSMGGLVLRRLLAERPALRGRIGRVVTVATPHFGTAALRGVRRFPEARWMRRRDGGWRGQPDLVTLLGAERVATIGSVDDGTVYPELSTRTPGAPHTSLSGIGHAGLLVWRPGRLAILNALRLPPR